jgi:uracil-DNA glycosylase
MRAAIALAAILAGCTAAPVADDPDAEGEGDGKEDTAGSKLCDSLPAASRDLCSQIPNNGWRTALKAELTQPYFEPLAQNIAAARAADDASSDPADNVYPTRDNTFTALRRLSPGRVKVVIVGQDPYINVNEAMGMSFSVSPGIAVPPSLRNIFVELGREAADADLGPELPAGFGCPANGDLTKWAGRGVLLLNAILTVRDGTPGSHKDFGWQSLSDAILRVVRDRNHDLATAYLLWGAFAQAKESLIAGRENGLNPPPNPMTTVLKSPHPSPLAQGFVGNGHFGLANRFLVAQGRTPVDWSLPAPAAGEMPAHCH